VLKNTKGLYRYHYYVIGIKENTNPPHEKQILRLLLQDSVVPSGFVHVLVYYVKFFAYRSNLMLTGSLNHV